jgi:hypothetical protein
MRMSKLSQTWLAVIMLFGSVALAQTVTGSGTTNKIPIFTGTSTIGNSPIAITGSSVGIGTTSPGSLLEVDGTGASTGLYLLRNGWSASIANLFTTTGVYFPRSLGLGVMSGNGYSADIPVAQPGWLGGYGGYIGLWSDENGGIDGSTNVVGIVSTPRGSGAEVAMRLASIPISGTRQAAIHAMAFTPRAKIGTTSAGISEWGRPSPVRSSRSTAISN